MSQLFSFKLLLVLAIFQVAFGRSERKKSPGIPYGNDCKYGNSMDDGILNQVVEIPQYREKYGNKPLLLLTDDKWTVEMEDVYAEGILADEGRCSVIEGLQCSLKTNENSPDLNFHHHHPSDPKVANGSTSPFEVRRADVVVEPNLFDFDLISELKQEWRCVCNPSISVHRGLQVEDGTHSYPYYVDKCLMKVGIPCQYQHNDTGHAHYFKATYPCVPQAECLPVFDESESEVAIDPVNNTSTTTTPPTSTPTLSSVAEIQSRIVMVVGYGLNLGGVRPAYLNYVLRHLTHVCQCVPGYLHNGNGLCVQSVAKGLEVRSDDLNGSLQGLDLSFKFLFMIIILLFQTI